MLPSVAFGRVLRKLRKETGLTQEQFGFECGLSRIYVSILELGQQQPSLTTLFKLAHALKCRPGRFIDLVESEMGEDGVSKLLLDDEAQAKEH